MIFIREQAPISKTIFYHSHPQKQYVRRILAAIMMWKVFLRSIKVSIIRIVNFISQLAMIMNRILNMKYSS